ncbi:Putative protein of unknown function [Podospora comata]|uniref:HNH nuclease domain-containing protein n=1 Tax=Podospora comata TaxID=48703 RepID=A0ABY6SK75_PODCO|nr:Putative protein of unknown function [Podospora comata]
MAAISEHPFVSTADIVAKSSSLSSLGSPTLSSKDSELTPVSEVIRRERTLALKVDSLDVLRSYIPRGKMDDTRQVLEAFVQDLPLEGGRVLMQEIVDSSATPKKLLQLRNFLVDAILKPVRHCGNLVITDGLDPDFGNEVNRHMAEIESSSRNEQAALRTSCLKRDGHGCVLSGFYEEQFYKRKLSAHEQVGKEWEPLAASHIIPFALGEFNERNAEETRKTAIIWWAIW